MKTGNSTKSTNTSSKCSCRFPVYVITSLSILRIPYEFGNPFVLETLIVVSDADTVEVVDVLSTTTSGVKLSTFKY